MRRPGLGAERLIGLFLIGAVGFSPPILTLFNKKLLVAGVPLLYFYLFALWIVLVALAARVASRMMPGEDARAAPPRGRDAPPMERAPAERAATERAAAGEERR